MFREATPEERRIFYMEEWQGRREIPDYILHTLSLREFGFALENKGQFTRHHQFITPDQLEDFLRRHAPYAAYVSTARYENPVKMEKWLGAELVFDVDAKDLPLKPCSCTEGRVCERCLEEARHIIASIGDVLRSDLGLTHLRYSYSGRGFHLRVLDESVQKLGREEREEVFIYVTGGVVPSDLTLAFGYSKVFRMHASRLATRLNVRELMQGGVKRRVAQELMRRLNQVSSSLRQGRMEEIRRMEGIGERTLSQLLKLLAELNRKQADSRPTVDTKRVLRLPSSLHSGVSMKCVEIRKIDDFSLDQAVPRFVRERSGGA